MKSKKPKIEKISEKEISEEEHYDNFKKNINDFKDNKNRKCDYVFTIFYDIPKKMTDKQFNEELKFKTEILAPTFCKYLIFGFEICPETKAKHLQGYLHFGDDKSSMIKTMKLLKLLDDNFKPWLQERYGTINRAVNYCKKGEQSKPKWFKYHENKEHDWGLNAEIIECGIKPLDRTDLLENQNLEQSKWIAIKQKMLMNQQIIKNDPKGPYSSSAVLDNQSYNLIYDIEQGNSLKDLIRDHPNMYLKYTNAFEKLIELFKPKPNFNLYKKFTSTFKWQESILNLLTDVNKINDRDIIVIYNQDGCIGKNKLQNHLEDQLNYNVVKNGTSRDISLMWEENRHSMMNWQRTMIEHINYTMIEEIKDARVSSHKYGSARKCCLHENWNFIIFTNYLPNFKTASKDRWIVYEVKNQTDDLYKLSWKEISVIEKQFRQEKYNEEMYQKIEQETFHEEFYKNYYKKNNNIDFLDD